MKYRGRKSYNRLSLECRGKVLEALSTGLSVQDVVEQFHVSSSTVLRIVKRNGIINNSLAVPQVYRRRKNRKLKWPQLDEALLRWCGTTLAQGAEITTVVLREQAMALAQQLGVAGFNRTANNWLYQWNFKHGIIHNPVNRMWSSRMRRRPRRISLKRWRAKAMNRASTAASSELAERNPPTVGSRYRAIANGDVGKKRLSDTPLDNERTHINHVQADSRIINGKVTASGRPRKQRILDADALNNIKDRTSHVSNIVPKCVPFEWTSYLEQLGTSAVVTSFFSHVPSVVQKECKLGRVGPQTINNVLFKPDQYLEGIDPHHESLFCALKVAEVVGRRIRLRFVGYPEKYDFWTTVDSPFLFPVGWCAHNRRRLQPPKSFLERDQPEFDWDSFLTDGKYTAVPPAAFSSPWDAPVDECPSHMFRVGFKLEAVDKRNPVAACVATIKDCIGDYVLIHFDGWDCGFDQWAHISSELLHPVGYCQETESMLLIPTDWSTRPSGFTWKQYLKETNSKPVPKEAFTKASTLFPASGSIVRVGQRLEAVDRRCPQLIRVANVVSTSPSGFLTIGYDGWPEKFNICLEASSADLFPVGYCQATDHPLQPPPGYDLDDFAAASGDAQSNSSTSSVSGGGGSGSVLSASCPTAGCKGYGHVKGPRHTTHQRISGCPYADANLKRDLIRAHDRLTATSIVSTIPDSTSPTAQMPKLEQQINTSTSAAAATDRLNSIQKQCVSPDSTGRTDSFLPLCAPISPAPSSGHVIANLCSSASTCSSTSSKLLTESSSPATNGSLAPSSHSPIPSHPSTTTNKCTPTTGLTNHLPDEPQSVPHAIAPSLSDPRATSKPLDLSVDRDKHRAVHDKPPELKEASFPDSRTYSTPTTDYFKPGTESAPPPLLPDTSTLNQPKTFEISETQSVIVGEDFKVTVCGEQNTKPDYASYPFDGDRKLSGPPRLSQPPLGSAVSHDYPRQQHQSQHPQQQQSITGLSGLPVKRKRGRPRKYTTVHVLHSTQNHTRAIQPFSPSCVPTPTPHPSSVALTSPCSSYNPYSTLLLGQQQASAMTQSTAMPTLTRYAPLTVSTPSQPTSVVLTNHITNGTTGTNHSMMVITEPNTTMAAKYVDQSPSLSSCYVARSISPIAVSVIDPSCSSSCSAAPAVTTVISPQSTSTEPAVHQRTPDTCFPFSSIPSSSSATSCLLASVTAPAPSQYTAVDFCSAHTLNGFVPYMNGFIPSHAPIPSPKLPDSSSILGWCTDSVGINGSYQLTLASQSNTSLFVPSTLTELNLDRPNLPGNGDSTSAAAAGATMPGRTRNPSQRDLMMSMGWADFDLMSRLLPQASAAIRAAKVAGLPGPHSWNAEMVGNFVRTLPGCKQFANKFVENEIDGAALLCLEQHDLMQILGMKLGPAVKVFSAIQTLRRSLLATPLTELGVEQSMTMEAATSCFSITHVSSSHGVKTDASSPTHDAHPRPHETNMCDGVSSPNTNPSSS